MTCPHAETTAILALFDEAPPDFADHLVGCPDCQATLAEHRETLAVVAPHMPTAPPRPRSRPRRAAILIATAALAAATLLAVRLWPIPPAGGHPTTGGDVLALEALDATAADDSRLLALELELALMHLEDNE